MLWHDILASSYSLSPLSNIDLSLIHILCLYTSLRWWIHCAYLVGLLSYRLWLLKGVTEKKPSLANQQCTVYEVKCDLCNSNNVRYTCQHRFQCINEHNIHVSQPNMHKQFNVLTKCREKLECLIDETLYYVTVSVIFKWYTMQKCFFNTWILYRIL